MLLGVIVTKFMLSFILMSLSSVVFSMDVEKLIRLGFIYKSIKDVKSPNNSLDFTIEKKHISTGIDKPLGRRKTQVVCIRDNISQSEVCLTKEEIIKVKEFITNSNRSILNKDIFNSIIIDLLTNYNIPVDTKLYLKFRQGNLQCKISFPGNGEILDFNIDFSRDLEKDQIELCSKVKVNSGLVVKMFGLLESLIS